jgi:hypothetical protein
VVDVPVGGDRPSAWAAALGGDVTDDDGRPTAAAAGTPVRLALPGGDALAGTVVHVAPGNELSVALDEPAGARLVAFVRPGPNEATSRVGIEVYAWGIGEAQRAANQARLDAAADALTGRPPGSTAAERAADTTSTPEERTMTDRSYPESAQPTATSADRA